jgi:hypothetical protein
LRLSGPPRCTDGLRWHPVDRLDEGLHGSRRSSVSSARRSQPFRASPLQRAMAVFRLSLTLVAAALARGACALCHRVRVRALGAIMCAVAFACKPCCCRQSDHRCPSLRALCRRDDSTWSMTRRAPSEVARFSSYASTCYRTYQPNFTFVHGLRPARELIAAVLAVS